MASKFPPGNNLLSKSFSGFSLMYELRKVCAGLVLSFWDLLNQEVALRMIPSLMPSPSSGSLFRSLFMIRKIQREGYKSKSIREEIEDDKSAKPCKVSHRALFSRGGRDRNRHWSKI